MGSTEFDRTKVLGATPRRVLSWVLINARQDLSWEDDYAIGFHVGGVQDITVEDAMGNVTIIYGVQPGKMYRLQLRAIHAATNVTVWWA